MARDEILWDGVKGSGLSGAALVAPRQMAISGGKLSTATSSSLYSDGVQIANGKA